jgi:hypothetical protein
MFLSISLFAASFVSLARLCSVNPRICLHAIHNAVSPQGPASSGHWGALLFASLRSYNARARLRSVAAPIYVSRAWATFSRHRRFPNRQGRHKPPFLQPTGKLPSLPIQSGIDGLFRRRRAAVQAAKETRRTGSYVKPQRKLSTPALRLAGTDRACAQKRRILHPANQPAHKWYHGGISSHSSAR